MIPLPYDKAVVVFSGDLGAPYTLLLPAPASPARADTLVIESTYGDRLHEDRKTRRQALQAICERAFGNRGTLLISASAAPRSCCTSWKRSSAATRRSPPPVA